MRVTLPGCTSDTTMFQNSADTIPCLQQLPQKGAHGRFHYDYKRVFYRLFDHDEQFIVDLLKDRCAGKRVLDYGCGEGAWARRAATLGAEACGIDSLAGSIELARRLATSEGYTAHFAVMDAHSTGFPAECFDYILVSGVLQYLDTDRAFAELSRILKSTGEVIAVEGLRHNPLIRAFRRVTPGPRSVWGAQRILGRRNIYKAERYFGLVRPLRFFHLFDLASVPFSATPLFPYARRLLASIDSRVLRLGPVRWYAWTVVFSLSMPKRHCSSPRSGAACPVSIPCVRASV